MRKAIVLAADYQYVEQVLTTIKSISYHNRNVKFYLINSDFPNEWFVGLNQKLAPLNSHIVNARVNSQRVAQYKTDISYTVFLRYFIGDFVEEERVLYLDCDMVVTRDLTPLFELDLAGHPLAAVKDLGGLHYFNERIFNAGMLLIDTHYWKKEQITQQLIELTNQYHTQVSSADQSILNMLFQDEWLELDFTYNAISIHTHFSDYDVSSPSYPTIIHYLTARKPWKPLTQSPFREVWWFYHDLEWTQINGDASELVRQTVLKDKNNTHIYIYIYLHRCLRKY